ncbi:hypothetical protein ACVXZ4_06405 [Lacisediminihabitans sp. FW035]
MTQTTAYPVMAPAGEPQPRGFGRVIVTGIVTAILYSALSTGSTGFCPGGYDENGFVDADGVPTTVRPVCLTVNFHPQAAVLLLLAAIVIVTSVILGRNSQVARAGRVTTIAALAILVIGLAATLATFPAFYNSSVVDWRGGPAPHFWFDAVTSITKMQ